MTFVKLLEKRKIPEYIAELLEQQLSAKPDSVLGLATGSTPIPIYQEFVKRYQQDKMNFKRVLTFNLDEYVGLSPDHPQSYRTFMREHLFRHIDIPADSTHVPLGSSENLDAEAARYEKRMEEAGGIDWQLLGIGRNGHIGFNEPGPTLSGPTHVVDLSRETLESNARFFGDIAHVPKQAITVGLRGIMKAKQIVLAAAGKEKAQILMQTLKGPLTTEVPASFLQLHPNAHIVVDEEAGSKIADLAD